jgi:hypothetical protein
MLSRRAFKIIAWEELPPTDFGLSGDAEASRRRRGVMGGKTPAQASVLVVVHGSQGRPLPLTIGR